MDRKLTLDTAVFNFYQECNTNGTTKNEEKVEKLSITMESVINSLDEDGGFFVIRTNGWSIGEEQELHELFQRIKNIHFG